MRFRHLAIAIALMLPAAFAEAEQPDTVKIGILNDMNGPFADQSGKGSVVTAQMAAENFAEAGGGFKVEILSADHLNKPDVGAQIVRAWVDRDGVSAVADSVISGVGLAVNTVMAEKHRTFIATNVGTSDLTGKFCQPTTVQWTMDTYALGTTMARAMAAQHDDTWYFISFDYALGAALERDSSAVLISLGGKVLGSVKHPIGTTDFSSYLLHFARRFAQRFNGRMPTANQAGVYSSVLAYLNAVKSANSIVGEDVVLQIRKQPIEDKLFGTVTVRQDGRAVHDMYTFKVKTPAESKARWDDYTVLARIPGDQAFRPLNQGGCKLVTN